MDLSSNYNNKGEKKMNKLFKKIEKILYDYKNIDLKIKNIDLHIDILMNDISCAGVSYEYTGRPSNTFNSSVENEVIRRDEHISEEINRLEKAKKDLITWQQIVRNAVEGLRIEDYKLVELRYFQRDKKTWIEIGMNLGMDKDTCCRAKNRIINEVTKNIYPSEAISNQFFVSF